MFKKFFSLFAALTLSVGLWAETATNVPYIDANGNPQICPEATIVEGAKVRQASWAAGWYVVPNTGKQIKYLYDVVCNGAVHLILADGCDLWVEEGIQVTTGKSLTIYGQSAQTGQLKADGGTYKPGIGVDAYAGSIGQITINGGHITATGNADCAGIGGGWYMTGSNITINGGYVTATGGSGAPGIGSGVGGGNASNIFISSNCVVKAGSSDILTDDDLVEHTSSEDIASKLAGKQYVLAMEVIVPKIASITSNPTTPKAGHEVAFSATVANFSGVPTYAYEVKKEGGSYAAIQDGKFLPTMSGNYTVKVTATYSNEVAYKEQAFTVASPEVGDSIFYDNVYYTVTSTNPSYTVEVGKNYNRFLDVSVFIPGTVPCDGHDFVVTGLGEFAFQQCFFDSLEIPASITYFAKNAFNQVPNIPHFFVAWTEQPLPQNDNGAFMIIFGYNESTLHVPFGTRKMYEEDHFWKSFGVIKERVEPGNRTRQNGILYEVLTTGETNTVKVVADNPAYSNTSYTLPTTITSGDVVYNVTEIGDNAFKNCSNVAEVTVAWTENLPTLGTDAFAGIADGAILYVPANTKTLYEAAGWDEYFTINNALVPTTYLDENGVLQNIEAWEIANASEAVTWGTAGETTWYVVNGEDVQLAKGAVCVGDVRLILADGAKLTATGGPEESAGENAAVQVSGIGNSITIYAQSTAPEIVGQLIATNDEINRKVAAGIGGGENGDGSNITINGGKVTAKGYYAAGIGGGENGDGSNITINGGYVTATGEGSSGAGIGGGSNRNGSNITINGGYVTAIGATGGAGIGGGWGGSCSNITINGGEVTATGGTNAPGIGGGSGGFGSNITINGGEVAATGGENAAGIGGGYDGSCSDITINGGTVTATGGIDGAGIGGGYKGSGSDIYISDAYVLKAGANADNTEVIDHSSATDLGSTLNKKKYVKIEGLATPYTRTMTIDQWATICLPYAATSFEGADFYKVNYYDASDPTDLKLYIEPVDNLVAGMPYIFETTADVVTIYHSATAPEAVTAGNERGLYGSFARKTIAYDGAYAYAAISNGAVNVVESGYTVTVPACRAYLDMDQVPTSVQPHNAPLRCMGVPRQQPTGNENVNANVNMNGKFIINGQFVIVKDGKMINALGF